MKTAAKKMKMNRKKVRVFDVVNGFLMVLLSLVFLVPFLMVISASLSDNTALQRDGISLIVKGFTFEGYAFLFNAMKDTFIRSMLVSLFVSVTTATLAMIVATFAAFALTRKVLPGRKFFNVYYLIPMFFSGGMIPVYLIVRGIGLYNTLWALIVPSIGGMYFILLLRNYMSAIPRTLEEAAELDGANDLQVFVHVIMPVTLPMMVSIWLMSFTSKWNDWASSLLYLGANNQKLWTLQYVLKQMIADMQALFGSSSSGSVSDAPLISAKNAGIVVSVIPLIVVCPLVQRFYISGVMAGSIKG